MWGGLWYDSDTPTLLTNKSFDRKLAAPAEYTLSYTPAFCNSFIIRSDTCGNAARILLLIDSQIIWSFLLWNFSCSWCTTYRSRSPDWLLTGIRLWAQICAHLNFELRDCLITFPIFVLSQSLIARNVHGIWTKLVASMTWVEGPFRVTKFSQTTSDRSTVVAS
jgi:hypothetical protein